MSRPAWNDRDVGGYLGKDPEMKTTANGTAVTNISIACPIYVNKATVTEWVNAALYGQLAEFCCKYGKKGDFVRVTGTQITKKFTDRNGNSREIVEVQANKFLILRSKVPTTDDEPL